MTLNNRRVKAVLKRLMIKKVGILFKTNKMSKKRNQHLLYKRMNTQMKNKLISRVVRMERNKALQIKTKLNSQDNLKRKHKVKDTMIMIKVST